MFRNYLTIAFRSLRKDKTHSLINIIGLSVGIAVAMLIGLWISDEVNFNKQFTNYNRTAQVIQNVTNNGEVQTWFSVPYPLTEDLRKNYGSDFKQVVMGLQAAAAACIVVILNGAFGLIESEWAITACVYVVAGTSSGTTERVRRRIVGTLVGVPLGLLCIPLSSTAPLLLW